MLEELKKQVLQANLNLVKYNLIDLTWGNVSGIDRKKGLVVIKPSGVDYSVMTENDLVVVDLVTGNTVEGNLKPSSDLPTHLELYRAFKDIGGVTHTHSKYATAFAQAKRAIPAFGTTHADHFFGEIPCARELTDEEIATEYEKNTGLVLAETFSDIDYNAVPAALVASHGVFSWGSNPLKSVENALVAERVAEMAYFTMALGNNTPVKQTLLDKHYSRKHGANAYYGQTTKKTKTEKILDIINNKKICSCGKVHAVSLKNIVMESGAILKLKEVIDGLGNYNNIVMVADENTYKAAGKLAEKVVKFKQKIILNPVNLHANERAVEAVSTQLKECDLLVAVGSGTVHDATRYVAYEKGLQFVSVPTAASVDGYVSSVAAMTWKGVKRTLTAVAPIAMVADSEIIAKAPYELTASGVGDLIGKYTALFDWRVSNILTGEYICDYIIDLEMQAVKEVVENLSKIKNQDVKAIEALTYGLVLSGLAMQMTGNSRPASGAEHHISHFIEMGVLTKDNQALHGEKVGVATALVCEKYHKALVKAITADDLSGYVTVSKDFINENFGSLAEEIIKENANDPLLRVDRNNLINKWEEIQKLATEFLPTGEEVRQMLIASGASVTLSDIDVNEDLLNDLYTLSPLVRNRLTFMRILKLVK